MIIEDNPGKYNSIPINAGAQYYKTTRTLKRVWPRKPLNIPTLAVASANDSVVDVPYIIKSFGKGFTGKKQLIIYSNKTDVLWWTTSLTQGAIKENNMFTESMESVELSEEEVDSISDAGWEWNYAAVGAGVGAQVGAAVSGGN